MRQPRIKIIRTMHYPKNNQLDNNNALDNNGTLNNNNCCKSATNKSSLEIITEGDEISESNL